MRRGNKQYFISLRTKVILLFFILITIPFLISGIITYRKYSDNVEASTKSYTLQIINQVKINLDRYIKDMERLTLAPLYDDTVLNILKNHRDTQDGPHYLTTEESLKMNFFVSSLSFERSEIRSILIFTNDGNLISNSESNINKYWSKWSDDWVEAVKKKDGELTIIPPHKASYYFDNTKNVVSIARVIREPYTYKTLGIVKVDLTEQGFQKILSSVSFSVNGRFYIHDSEGRLIYPIMEQIMPIPDGERVRFNGNIYMSSTVESNYTGLKMTGLVPMDDLRKDARDMISFTLIISLISLVFAYILAALFSDRLVKPIRYLQGKMKQVQKGSFSIRADVQTHDEIGQLAERFNTMVEEIDKLVKEVYEVRLRERDAELIALQSQINPHFLYNTLETINMMALEKKDTNLSDIVTSLGRLLRYTVDKQEKPVFLKDELSFVESYLQIQSFRLGEKLNIEIHIDPSFENCMIPKLILQPFIENVIEHAVDTLPVTVRLRAWIENEDFFINIQDDGVGMNDDIVKFLEDHMYSEKNDVIDKHSYMKKGKGYAMRNVHQRIRLLYGIPYGVYIDKTINEGAAFIIRLPFRLEDSDA